MSTTAVWSCKGLRHYGTGHDGPELKQTRRQSRFFKSSCIQGMPYFDYFDGRYPLGNWFDEQLNLQLLARRRPRDQHQRDHALVRLGRRLENIDAKLQAQHLVAQRTKRGEGFC